MGSPQHFIAQTTLQDDTHTPAVSGHVSPFLSPLLLLCSAGCGRRTNKQQWPPSATSPSAPAPPTTATTASLPLQPHPPSSSAACPPARSAPASAVTKLLCYLLFYCSFLFPTSLLCLQGSMRSPAMTSGSAPTSRSTARHGRF